MGGGKGESLVGELLALANEQLSRAGIPSPPDEARLLLAEVLGVSLAWVMAHPEARVPPDRRLLFHSYVDRRAAHEPVAYVVGHKEFYGLDLEVGPAVLIPRPETELLVENALSAAERLLHAKGRDLQGADLGTGSGAVAIALAARQPRLKLIAVDSSTAALRVARANAALHRVIERIDFRQGDLLGPVEEQLDLLVGNLPYIPTCEIDRLMPDVSRYEPREALDGGPDGTVPTRRALEQAVHRMDRPAALLFEIGNGQGTQLADFAHRLYPDGTVRVLRDYAGFERILSVDLPERNDAMQAEIVKWPKDAARRRQVIRRAAGLIRAREVVAFPTDTVYGIGALAWDRQAVRRLYAIKERPQHKAIALLLSGPEQLKEVTDCAAPELQQLARRFWPGGLTIVVPWRRDLQPAGESSIPTVGVRVPNHPIPLALIQEVGAPLATTSANLSGAPSPTTAQEVARQIGDRIALIIDGGRCPGGVDSTVVDLTTEPATVRRLGAVPVEELAALLGPVKVEV